MHLVGSAGSAATVFNGGDSTARYNNIFHLAGNSSVEGVTVTTAKDGIEVYGSQTSLVDVVVTDMEHLGVSIISGANEISFTATAFSDCFAGIADTSGSLQQLTLSESAFIRCGIGLRLDASVLKNVTVSSVDFSSGGTTDERGLYIYSEVSIGTVQILDCTFRNFDSDYSDGTAIGLQANAGNVSIVNCEFQNMTCTKGALYVDRHVDVVVEDCIFTDISSTNSGGAIYSISSGSMKVVNSTFHGNTCGSSGGAIFIGAGSGNFTTQYTSFFSNTAGVDGGAIFVDAPAVIEDCTFHDNSAGNGGAVYSQGSLQLLNSTFDSNAADNGGAVYIAAIASDSVSLKNCKFYSNSATGNGGALCQDQSTVLMLGVVLVENNATNRGGGVYTQGALNMIGGVLEGCSANTGGGIYIDSYSSSVNIRYAKIENNVANYGGGFACYNAGVFLDAVNFNSNVAKNGSAYYCTSCTITSVDVTVDSNNTIDCSQDVTIT